MRSSVEDRKRIKLARWWLQDGLDLKQLRFALECLDRRRVLR